jgi:hypothetical protein
MPLCPQITNTPVTVTQTADFTVSSVLPVVAATTTQLDAVEVLVNGKAQIFYQTTAPVGAGINEDDLWYDTDDGNKPYIFRSGVWVSVQDGSIATAQSAANTALANAAAANAVGVAAQNTANTALANAAIADAKGVAAQNTANTALANASTAYNAAIGSLQPSASTIVNASNQITAIASNGITVYSGASATTGARVVLNSAGLAGFNAGGTATFSISASTGAAVFSGSVTGSTITGGTLNIGGNAIIDASGFLTATGATITGTITTSNITVTGGTLTIGSTFAVTSGGVLTATGATITGTLTSNNVTITGGTLTIGSKFSVTSTGVLTAVDGTFTGTVTSTNATITGGSLTVGSTFSVTSAGVLTATSGTVGGFTISGSSIFAGTSLVLNTDGTLSGGNSSTLFYGFVNIGGGSATGERLIVAGTSALNGNTGVLGNLTVTNSVTFGAITQQFEFLSSSGNVRVAQTYNNDMGGTTRAMRVSTTGLYGYASSTRRRKEQIENYSIDSNALLNLPIKKFKYKNDESGVQQYGFIAEDAQELGLDELIQYDSTGVPDYFAYETLPIFLLQLIQELKAEIDQLKGE